MHRTTYVFAEKPIDAVVPAVVLLLVLLRTLTSLNSNCSGWSAFAFMSLSTPA
jgi:hypothetical protein